MSQTMMAVLRGSSRTVWYTILYRPSSIFSRDRVRNASVLEASVSAALGPVAVKRMQENSKETATRCLMGWFLKQSQGGLNRARAGQAGNVGVMSPLIIVFGPKEPNKPERGALLCHEVALCFSSHFPLTNRFDFVY